jgi:superfamily II DNA or RNA helicase
MYNIPKNQLSQYQLNLLRSKLIAKPKTIMDTNNQFELFKETSKWISIPRYYGMIQWGIPKLTRFGNCMKISNKCYFKSTLYNTPHNNQQHIANSCLAKLTKSKYNIGSGIIVIPTGYGKTVTALWLIVKLKYKALVLVNSNMLLKQWINRIKNHVAGINIGIIQKDTCNIDGYDIVVGMIQSFRLRKYEHLDKFGTVIFDECHHAPAKTFSNTIFKLSPRFLIGLSAEPKRKDGLFYVLKWIMGPILYQQYNRKSENISVHLVNITHSNFTLNYINRNKNKKIINNPKLINNLCNDFNRNKIIIKYIWNLLNICSIPRKCLLFTSRISHIKFLKQKFIYLNHSKISLFDNILKKIFKSQMISINETISTHICSFLFKTYTIGELNSSISHNNRDKELQKDIIIVTYNIAKEGLDIKGANTAFLTTPCSDMKQVLGRVLSRGSDTNKDIIIVDFMDQLHPFRHKNLARIRTYKNLNSKFSKIVNNRCMCISHN